MNTQIVIGRYDGNSPREFYNPTLGIIRVSTEYGRMWVPLARIAGKRTWMFKPDEEVDLVIIRDPDQILSTHSTRDEAGEEQVLTTEDAVAIVAQLPPQYIREFLSPPEDEVNVPSKILLGSNSKPEDRTTFGADDNKIIASDELIAMKGSGGQIVIGNDGIIFKGNQIRMDWFSGNRGGVLKENWLANLIPTSVVTPFPMYLPDTRIMMRIAGLPAAIKEATG